MATKPEHPHAPIGDSGTVAIIVQQQGDPSAGVVRAGVVA
jgi:hypothetical protein